MLSPPIRQTDNLRFAVIGSPIEHSLSTKIHQCFAKQFGIQIQYDKIEVNLGNLQSGLAKLDTQQYIGVNVTSPLKQEIFSFIDLLSNRAKHAMAVNTFSFLQEGGIWGDNTDGIGFIRDLVNVHAVQLARANILLLGAGGAAKGILRPLLSFNPRLVTICNRDLEKAKQATEYFKPWGKVKACDYISLKAKQYDLIINATSAGLHGEAPELPDNLNLNKTICYDLNYGDAAIPFIRQVKSKGARMVLDGFGMLMELAAESFYIWHHVRPNVAQATAELKSELNKSLG